MGLQQTVSGLARQARAAARDVDEEARAQHLADRFRAALLHAAPDDLPQAQFLCIVAAVLGRFSRDMAVGNAMGLVDALAAVMQRHAEPGA